MITRRTLERWRRESLTSNTALLNALTLDKERTKIAIEIDELNKRILKLTQELLDQHLIKRRL